MPAGQTLIFRAQEHTEGKANRAPAPTQRRVAVFTSYEVMTISIRSAAARWTTIAVGAIVFLVLLVFITRTYFAVLVSRKPTLHNLQLAARLDPKNADYRRGLGRLYQYSLDDIDPQRAMPLLSQATQLNPYDPQAWLDLGLALELQGKIDQAEACLRRTDFLAPNLPAFQWAIANFFLLHGNVDEAFRHFKVVLGSTPQYRRTIFNTAWKASGDAKHILDTLIPDDVSSEFDYLYYLLGRQQWADAQTVWERISTGPQKFAAEEARPYLDHLIYTMRRPDEAYQVWSELLKKGLIRPTEDEASPNLVFNGHFEEEPLNSGFDWRIMGVEGIFAGLDETTYRSAGHSLLIQFSGKDNVDYRNVFQFVKVLPGHSYRLAWFIKTEAITTDSGPRMEVRDAYDPRALDKFSESVIGTSETWSAFNMDFKTGPKTELIVVAVARLPSAKLDNQIAGKVWVDDVSLVLTSDETERASK